MDFFQSRFLSRDCKEDVIVNSDSIRIFNIFRVIQEALEITDNQNFYFFYLRDLNENVRITQYFSHLKYFIRGLQEIAGSEAQAKSIRFFYRENKDTVQASGGIIRNLFIFIKVFSTSVIRDLIIKRFLVAKEELSIKSCITFEITIESKII